jgi:hypothetical protein
MPSISFYPNSVAVEIHLADEELKQRQMICPSDICAAGSA